MDSNYNTVQIVNVTDWMNHPYLLQEDSNFDNLLRGLLHTKGRLSQPSYNQLVHIIFILNTLLYIELYFNLNVDIHMLYNLYF